MKIHNEVNRALPATDTTSTAKSGHSISPIRATDKPAAVGSVHISEASRSLQAAGASHAEAPFDAKRVEAIKAAISAGHFKVNPEAIADKVIDSASQLLSGKA